MKNKEFYDQDHAIRYLNHSIIRVDNVPVLIERIDVRGSSLYAQYHPIERMADAYTKQVLLKSPRINMNPVPLGYVNWKNWNRKLVALKAFRIPQRAWKIGLTTRSLRILPGSMERETKDMLLYSKYMKATICNDFPSLEHVLSKIRDKDVGSVAFSRRFSLSSGGSLFFIQLSKKVGEVYKNTLKLYDRYMFLSELLEKDMRR